MAQRKKPRTAAVSSSSGDGDIDVDRITALPLELRAHIASYLSFAEIVQLTVLSRPWRYIHHHTPVVEIYLHAFLHYRDIYVDEAQSIRGLLDRNSILGVRVTLGRRAQEASASRVDTLRLVSDFDDRRMSPHAARIVALADARVIRIEAAFRSDDAARRKRNAWTLDLEITARSHILPAIAGPGAAALQKLRLDDAVVAEWPGRLPCLVSLDLSNVTFEANAPLAPGNWCPLLDELDLFECKIEHARVDIILPRLRFLEMDGVDVVPPGRNSADVTPYGVVTVDAPELIEFEMDSPAGGTTDFRSFTLRAPRLRFLAWRNQFAERMVVDVGRPGCVTFGGIQLRTVYFRREMEYFREQMMRMLQGILPNIPPENLADAARPYLTLGECSDSDDDDDEEPKDKRLTCDLSDLIMLQGPAVSTVINNGDVPEAEDDAVAAIGEEASAEGCTRTQVGPRRSTRPKRPSTRTSGPEWKN